MNQLPKAKYSDIIIQETAKELLLYDLTLHKAFCLNETAAIVWRNRDGKNIVQFCCSGSLAVPINVSCNPLAGFPGVFTCSSPCA